VQAQLLKVIGLSAVFLVVKKAELKYSGWRRVEKSMFINCLDMIE
jgi:hypothetical protein